VFQKLSLEKANDGEPQNGAIMLEVGHLRPEWDIQHSKGTSSTENSMA
jgi:hypothetical protein